MIENWVVLVPIAYSQQFKAPTFPLYRVIESGYFILSLSLFIPST